VRIIVTGCRRWDCRALADRVIARLVDRHGKAGLVLIHGACPTGVDRAFEEACSWADVAVERHPADWAAFGNWAGPRRNQEMTDAGADLCLAFHPSLRTSKGTGDMVRRALQAHIPTWWTRAKDEVPVRLLEFPSMDA
jgi:hypothetical protein